MEPGRDEGLSRSLQDLQRLLLDTDDVLAFLRDLTHLAAGVVQPRASCSITTRRDGRPLTLTPTDSRARELDEAQDEVGTGPFLQGLDLGEEVYVADFATESRWPRYTEYARARGLRCSLTMPMTVQGDTLAALNLYDFDRPDVFGEDKRATVRVFASQAAGALHLARRREGDVAALADLENALDSRSVIDQALGILMGQQRCSAATAFDLLRARSQSEHRKIRDIAADLVYRVSGAPPEPGKHFDR